MAEIKEHLVEFVKYCNKCKNKDVDEKDDPCDICLETGGTSTGRPEYYEEEK